MASGLAFPDRSVFALDFVRLPSFAPEVAFRLCLADAVYWKLSVKSCVFTDCIPVHTGNPKQFAQPLLREVVC